MFILPPRRTGSHGESPPPPSHPPGAVPLGSGIRCSDFGAVNPGGGVVEVAGAALMGAV